MPHAACRMPHAAKPASHPASAAPAPHQPPVPQVRGALRGWAAAQLASQPLFPEGCLIEKEAPS